MINATWLGIKLKAVLSKLIQTFITRRRFQNVIDVIILCKHCGSPNHYLCPFNGDISVISDYDSDNVDIVSDGGDDSSFKIVKKHKNSDIGSDDDGADADISDNSIIKNFKVDKNSFESIRLFFMNEIKKDNLKIKKKEKRSKKVFNAIDTKNCLFCYKCGKTHYGDECKYIFGTMKEEMEFGDYSYGMRKEQFPITKNPLKYGPIHKKEFKINHHQLRNDYYNENDSSGESYGEMYNNRK